MLVSTAYICSVGVLVGNWVLLLSQLALQGEINMLLAPIFSSATTQIVLLCVVIGYVIYGHRHNLTQSIAKNFIIILVFVINASGALLRSPIYPDVGPVNIGGISCSGNVYYLLPRGERAELFVSKGLFLEKQDEYSLQHEQDTIIIKGNKPPQLDPFLLCLEENNTAQIIDVE